LRPFYPKNNELLLLLLRLFIAGTLFTLALRYYHTLSQLDVRALVAATASATAAVALLLGVYAVKSLLFVVPASLIYIYVGMAYGKPQALLLNFVGIALEISITYLLGRFLGGAYVERLLQGKKFGERLKRIRSRNKAWAVLAIRALPVFPIDFVSLFLGAYRDPFLLYFLTSLLGILPRVALFTLLGDGIYRYIPMRQIVFGMICCVPLLAVYWVARYLRKRQHRRL